MFKRKRKLEEIDKIAISLNNYNEGIINLDELYSELMKIQRKSNNVILFEKNLKALSSRKTMYLLLNYKN